MSTGPVPQATRAGPQGNGGARTFWLRQLTSWHWISAAVSLLGMLGFALTGLTLNHAGALRATPKMRTSSAVLSPALREELAASTARGSAPLPPDLVSLLDRTFKLKTTEQLADWSAAEIYLTLRRPGGYATISIDRRSGQVHFEDTSRGAVAFLNDLHKGRDTGRWWSWFIDGFAVACSVFCLTGLGLLWLKSRTRRSTWPLVAVGVAIPVVLAAWFLH